MLIQLHLKKIDEIAKEKKISRQEFLKGQIETLAVFQEQKDREAELENIIDQNIKMMEKCAVAIETIEDTLVKEREKNQSPEKSDEKQQQADPLSSENVQEKMKEGYEDYKQKQQQESAQNVDSILDRVTAEEKYYSTKTQAIKNGWMTKEEVVKLEHQIDSTMTKNEKGVINGQVQEQSFTFQDRMEVGSQMQFQKRTGTVKKKKEEQELER